MSQRRLKALSYSLAGLTVGLVSVVQAQGTAEDYERAAGLQARFSSKLLNAKISPQWFEEGGGFWFRRTLEGGSVEFLFADTAKREARPAFDHQRVAGLLTKSLGREVSATDLPVVSIEGSNRPNSVTLLAEYEKLTIDLMDYEVVENGTAEGLSRSTVEVLAKPARSIHGREPTSVRFVNTTDTAATLSWFNKGKRVSYGEIPAGTTRDQHTFDGHVWIAADPTGQTLNVFRATSHEGLAFIDGVLPEEDAAEPTERATVGLSPEGGHRAYFHACNVFVEEIATGEARALTDDGTPDNPYSGTLWWSPDSTRLVVLQTQKGGDRRVYYVESSPEDQVNPKLHSYPYLKPGDPIPSPQPRLIDLEAGQPIAITGGLTVNPWSIDRIAWEPDSSSFSFLYNQRGHKVMQLVSVDARTGESNVIIDERPETFFCYSHKEFLERLPETGDAIWMSERSGWNHLYLIDSASGEVKNPITAGDWVVRKVLWVDAEERRVWFVAGGIHDGQDPYFRHVARVNLDGSGLVVLTEGDGDHDVDFSPDMSYLLDTWSRIDRAPVHELRDAADGSLVCEVARADVSALVAEGWKAPEAFVAKGRDGKTDIHGMIVRPTNYDPAGDYPVIESIYAGPHSAFVPKSFRTYYKLQELAELGFIVVKIDGMGTSHRSKAFHDVCWKNLGDSGFPDRIKWIRAAAAKDPAMNLDRVGIYGGSAGGQSSTRALLAHGDFYHAAVSDCGCHDNRVDKIWWNEQWMGWPIGPHYEEQSNVTQAHRLTGDLMLVVGEMDENVDPASTMQVVNALIEGDRDFDLLVMPGQGHGAAESDYGRRRRADFFVRRLMGREPRVSTPAVNTAGR